MLMGMDTKELHVRLYYLSALPALTDNVVFVLIAPKYTLIILVINI